MTVFVVITALSSGEDASIVAVFADEGMAQACADSRGGDPSAVGDFYVEQHELISK